jgi:hypothetical protein
VSLYVSVWKERVGQPSLSLLFSDPPESTDKLLTATVENPANRQAIIRLRVKNKPNRRTARDAEVLIEKIWAENGERVTVEDWPLRWAFSPDDAPTIAATIPPGVSRRVTLCWAEDQFPAQLFLGNWPDTTNGRDILAAGTWHIRLVLTATDTPSTFWETTVHYDGTFEDNPLNRITVSQPKRRRSN